MEITTSKEGNATVVTVRGRLDGVSAPEMGKTLEHLISTGERHLILDFAELIYISSAGLRVLLAAAKKLKGQEGSLSLACLGNVVKKVFAVSGFDAVIPVFTSVAEARSGPASNSV